MRTSPTLLLGLALACVAGPALAGSSSPTGDEDVLVFGAHGLSVGLTLLGALALGVAGLVGLARVSLAPVLALALGAGLLVLGLDVAALAQTAAVTPTPDTTTTVVTLPYGEAIAGAQSILTTVLTAVLTGLLAFLPFPLRWAANAYGVQNLVRDSLGLAIAAIPGAQKDAKLNLNVGSAVLARAIQYAVDSSPRLVKSVGGVEGLQDKLIAAMKLEPDVTAARLLEATPNAVKGGPTSKDPISLLDRRV